MVMRQHHASNAGKRRTQARAARWMSRHRRGIGAALCLVTSVLWATSASAQLDPLLFTKRVPPTVIIVLDTSLQMLEDGSGNFYDPSTYASTADPGVMSAFPNINPVTQPFHDAETASLEEKAQSRSQRRSKPRTQNRDAAKPPAIDEPTGLF